MANGLRLVWSSPLRRAPGGSPPAGSPPPSGVAEARALVDDWVCTPFENGPAALDDLVRRIAAAMVGRKVPITIAAAPATFVDLSEPH